MHPYVPSRPLLQYAVCFRSRRRPAIEVHGAKDLPLTGAANGFCHLTQPHCSLQVTGFGYEHDEVYIE